MLYFSWACMSLGALGIMLVSVVAGVRSPAPDREEVARVILLPVFLFGIGMVASVWL